PPTPSSGLKKCRATIRYNRQWGARTGTWASSFQWSMRSSQVETQNGKREEDDDLWMLWLKSSSQVETQNGKREEDDDLWMLWLKSSQR
ncbi:MAG: hypothetical protein KDA38_14705, partial [Planctomycetales bacterium]|nr:hypothetical protein [Planctomycetales bacterium]